MNRLTLNTLSITSIVCISCGINSPSKKKQEIKDTYLLIHGSFHGAWCWDRLKPILERKGFNVICPDLPNMGKELYSSTNSIGVLLSKQQQPVILLGHSSGGMVISKLAKRYPKKIKGLIYLSAFLLPDGIPPPEIMKNDTISIMQSSLLIDEINGTVSIDKRKAKRLFYGDCSDSLAKWAIEKLTPEPIIPKNQKRTVKIDNVVTIPIKRFYIQTLHDRALGIGSQRKMQALMPCFKVFSLDSGHSPFLSQPDKLAEILISIRNSLLQK